MYDYLDLYGYDGIATAPGLPATVIPIGTTSAGLPIGIEIVGPFLEDLTTLRFAQAFEREFGELHPTAWLVDGVPTSCPSHATSVRP